MATLVRGPAPDMLISRVPKRSQAIYIDVNPVPKAGTPILLHDAAAVFASIRNLLLCPRGGRSRIFQEDYFSGLYDLLQEPLDSRTATEISIFIYQAMKTWEPRVAINPSDVSVEANNSLPGYLITISIVVLGNRRTHTFKMPIASTSFG